MNRYLWQLALLVLLPAAATAAEKRTIEGKVVRYSAPLTFHETKVPAALSLSAVKGCLASGDVDNDGRDELIVVDKERRELSLVAFPDDSRSKVSAWTKLPPGQPIEGCVSGDFSGDGRTDIALMSAGGRDWVYVVSSSDGEPVQRAVSFDIPEAPFLTAFRAVRPGEGERDGILLSAVGEPLSRWVAAKSGEQIWVYRSPDLRGEVAGDFTGRGGIDVLIRERPEPARWRLTSVSSEKEYFTNTQWLTFDREGLWEVRGAGDFNGDGLDDLLLEGEWVKGWWIGISDASQLLVQPLRGISRGRTGAIVGDYNGDGRSDLVSLLDEGGPTAWLALAESAEGLPGVTVRGSSGEQVTTDEQGRFAISIAPEEQLTVEKIGFVFSQSPLAIRHYFGRQRKHVGFVGTDISAADGIVGRAEVLGRESGPGPFVCVGFNPERDRSWGAAEGRCHQGYAYYSFRDMGREDTNARRTRVDGACCRLPAADILTGELAESIEACPEGYVGVGGRNAASDEFYLVCEKVNLKRYRLGPSTRGRYFGVGYSMWKERARIEGSQVPVALRYALGRSNFIIWTGEQCVGEVPGMLVVAKRPRSCASIEFRELQYAGLPGDPPAGTPVPMLPNCTKIENEFDPTSGCRP